MRKTFKFFCAAAVAALTVSSCGKIWDEFDSVHNQLDSIEARLDSLETSLNGQVATINTTLGALAKADEALAAADKTLSSKLEAKDAELAEAIAEVVAALEAGEKELTAALEKLGEELGVEISTLAEEAKKALADAMTKVAVQKVVKNEAGNYVLTFADGSTLEVAAADANANNTGLVTVVEGEWHVVLADGTTESLGVPVGHVDLVFEVDYETKELLYSVDGGETFVGTGAYVADADYYLVTDFTEDEKYVTIVIGGQEYNLPKYNGTESLLLAGKTYFYPEEYKTFELKNAKSAFVVSVPEGWSAEITTNPLTLEVEAPAEDAIIEPEGKIEIWMLGYDGKVFSAVLPVAIGDEKVAISFDKNTNLVTFEFAEDEFGETPIFFYGACAVEDFDAEAILENYINYGTNMDPNTQMGSSDPVEVAISKLVPNLDGSKDYVIWAFEEKYEMDWMTFQPKFASTPDDFVKVFCKINPVAMKTLTPSLADADMEFEVLAGVAEGFYGIFMSQEMYEMIPMYIQYGMATCADILGGMFMNEGVAANLYKGLSYKGKLSEFGRPAEYLEAELYNDVYPVSSYYVGVLPVNPGQTASDLSWDDIVFTKVSTKTLTPGATIEHTITETSDYNSFTLNIAVKDAAYMLYSVYPEGDAPITDEDVAAELPSMFVPDEFRFNEFEGEVVISDQLGYYDNPGDKFDVVLVIIAEDATYQIVRKTVATKSLPISEDMSAAITAEFDENAAAIDATVTITGNATKLAYACNTATSYVDKSLMDVLKNTDENPDNDNTDWTVVELPADATSYDLVGLPVKQTTYSTPSYYVHVALVDADGNVSHIATSNKVVVPKKTN